MAKPLWLRAAFAVLALPGMAAGLLPALIAGFDRGPSATGLGFLPLGLGLVIFAWCVADFFRRGRGTLAPWDPPTRLVTGGLYRYSRNPMYLGVLAIVTGWALLTGSGPLGWYAAGLALAFHLRVVWYEEPTLARSFGSDWAEYAATVPRWIGPARRRPAA